VPPVVSSAEGGARVAGITSTSHTAQYVDFLAAVRNGTSPLVSVTEALRTLAVVRAIYSSADAGRPVRIADVVP
jgi:UDP-N-acetyl-2-amino-2-deoxyglucuronate dehydrogenase